MVVLVVVIAGCVKQPPHHVQPGMPKKVWPPAPDKARIQYLYSISRPEDIGVSPSFFKKVVRVLTGKKEFQQIVRPYGIFVSSEEVLYVADPGMHAVHLFDLRDYRYDTIKKFKKKELVSPIGVAMDSKGFLYISDSILKTVFVYNEEGDPERTIGEADQFLRPTGVSVHPLQENLYVVDTNAHVIKVFDLTGNFLFSIGRRGTEKGAFNYPTSLSIDREGLLYVTDSLNFRIQVFKPDGEFLYLFGKHGDGMGEFSHPKGVALDSEGNIYVTDAIFDAIQIFDKRGTLLLYLGGAGQGPGQFWIPTELFIDSTNRIFVSDSYNQRVQVLSFLGGGEQ
jgi:DNA-binding beta-propeller fold protein YncE